MPTRSYYFPKDFKHLEEILLSEPEGCDEGQLEYFRELGLPPIPTVGTLALFLGISPTTIFSIRRNSRKHYRSFELRKKDGKVREIDTPRTYLKVIQWWILDNILNHIKLGDNIFGFVVGKSAIQNAKYHHGAKHVLNVDIKNFFPSITIKQVSDIFQSLGYNKDVSEMLSEICCLDDCVPQGAPTSPAIANLVLRKMDEKVSSLSQDYGHKYSRYADDLTFSSQDRIEEKFLSLIKSEVENTGFELKNEKTRFSGMEGRMEVTGVVINEKLQPSRVWRKQTRSALHHLKNAPRLTRKNHSYLLGIKGMAAQFPESPQMQDFSITVESILSQKLGTIIGRGEKPLLPNKLTIRQAEALAQLSRGRTNIEIAMRLGTTEAAVKKRLQEAYRKIDTSDRRSAENWANKNI